MATAEKNKRLPAQSTVLSFKPVGRILDLSMIEAEYALMSKALKKPPTASTLERICRLSGTHLLKLNTARAESGEAVLRFYPSGQNSKPSLLPSTNAPDIPYAKVIYRPLEIKANPPKSLVDYILDPDELSDSVTEAFSKVFGSDCLSAITRGLLDPLPPVQRLPAADFPIIFLPNPEGGDIQVTPVAPATAYMGMREVIEPYFAKRTNDGQHTIRPSLSRQAISGKPQNISGAIGGPRIRFHARMPDIVSDFEAQLLRYQHGGAFPPWKDAQVAPWVLRYADFLDKERDFSNSDIRAARDRIAKILIQNALSYIEEIQEEMKARQVDNGLVKPPSPSVLLLNRWWANNTYDRARRALTAEPFRRVEQQMLESR